MDDINNLVKSLARIRVVVQVHKDRLAAEVAAFEARRDIEQMRESVKFATALEADLTARIREAGIDQPHPALKVKNMTVVTIDQDKAKTWARENMKVAIREELDLKLVEDYAKKNTVEWATVEEKKQVTIARDLSEYVPAVDHA